MLQRMKLLDDERAAIDLLTTPLHLGSVPVPGQSTDLRSIPPRCGPTAKRSPTTASRDAWSS